MDNSAIQAILMVTFGAVAGLLVSWLKQKTWSDDVKFLLTEGVCLVMALVEMALTNQLILGQGLTIQSVVLNLLAALGAATFWYKTLFNKSQALAKPTT